MAEQPTDEKEKLSEKWEIPPAKEYDPSQIDPEDETLDHVLNQDEISSLLSLGQEEGGAQGIKILINSSNISYERLPMLEVIFDRFVRLLTTTLRNFTSDNVEVSLHNITSIRFGDYLNSIPLPCLIGVFKAVEWDSSALITVENELIYAMIEVLLGGKKGAKLGHVDSRSFTPIERGLVEKLIKVVLSDLERSFEPLSRISFQHDRLESNPRFATIVRSMNAAILVKITVDMDEKGGCIEFLIPYSTIEPIRDDLLQMFMGEKFGQDSIWEDHLGGELWNTKLRVDAVLDELAIKLDDVLSWEKGSFLPLNAKPESTIQMKCGDTGVFSGKLGQRNRFVSVQLERNFIKENQERLQALKNEENAE